MSSITIAAERPDTADARTLIDAIGLYERAGFRSVGPFGDYKPDPLSRFYEKELV